MIGSILWGLFAGLFRALVAPIAQWLHDRQVRAEMRAEVLSEVKQHEAEALAAAMEQVRRNREVVENADDLELMRLNAAYRDAILADRLHKSHGND